MRPASQTQSSGIGFLKVPSGKTWSLSPLSISLTKGGMTNVGMAVSLDRRGVDNGSWKRPRVARPPLRPVVHPRVWSRATVPALPLLLEEGPAAVLAGDEERVVRVAPGPLLTRLRGADEGVPGLVGVGRGMTVRAVVAAAGAAADEALPEVDPAAAHLDTRRADRLRVRNVGHRTGEVGAGQRRRRHRRSG